MKLIKKRINESRRVKCLIAKLEYYCGYDSIAGYRTLMQRFLVFFLDWGIREIVAPQFLIGLALYNKTKAPIGAFFNMIRKVFAF
jgi:hypothetical protein